MRSILCLALAIPLLALAVPKTPMTVLPDETTPVDASQPIDRGTLPRGNCDGTAVIGIVDTIGGTTYDWLANGAALRQLVNSPQYGIHALWMYSTAMSGTEFPDRNMRYNFYDYENREWNWIDSDHMQSGVGVYTERVGFGHLSRNPVTDVAVTSSHHASSGGLAPSIGKDMAPGAGIFEYCVGEPTLDPFAWNRIAVAPSQEIVLHMMDYSDPNNPTDVYWTKSQASWCDWNDPVTVPPPQPQPDFPDHNIAVSRTASGQNICLTWVYSPDGYSQKPGFYRISNDNGANWGPSTQLDWPAAYGGDTLTSFHITSLFPFYDLNDELHIVADVAPFVRDTNYILPAEIWHWDETDGWTEIFRGSDSILAPIGYNAVMACRPSMGCDANNNLFVAWENFDGVNYEQGPPERLRADIWWSHSSDGGSNWATPQKITDGGSVTYRFPCIMDYITDTVAVVYLIDQHAGFVLYAEGPHTSNPIVVQKWENPYGSGVNEERPGKPRRMEVTVTPNPFGEATRLSFAVPVAGDVSFKVYDVAGRPVRTLASGRYEVGVHNTAWDGKADDGLKVAAGVYAYKFVLDDKEVSGRLTLTE